MPCCSSRKALSLMSLPLLILLFIPSLHYGELIEKVVITALRMVLNVIRTLVM
jgi:hypothetical protein